MSIYSRSDSAEASFQPLVNELHVQGGLLGGKIAEIAWVRVAMSRKMFQVEKAVARFQCQSWEAGFYYLHVKLPLNFLENSMASPHIQSTRTLRKTIKKQNYMPAGQTLKLYSLFTF
jgi:hypothetical protein